MLDFSVPRISNACANAAADTGAARRCFAITISSLVVVAVPIHFADCVPGSLNRPFVVERSMRPIQSTVAATQILAADLPAVVDAISFLHPSNIGLTPIQ